MCCCPPICFPPSLVHHPHKIAEAGVYRIDVKGAKGGGAGEDGVVEDDRQGGQGAHVWGYFNFEKVRP